MSDFDDECYFCEGKGYLDCCPVDMGDETPEAHTDCSFCGGEYYNEYTCPNCDGTGKM